MTKVTLPEREGGWDLLGLYDEVARLAGVENLLYAEYDCRDICIAENVQDAIYEYYTAKGYENADNFNSESDIKTSITIMLAISGPKVDKKLANNEVSFGEKFITVRDLKDVYAGTSLGMRYELLAKEIIKYLKSKGMWDYVMIFMNGRMWLSKKTIEYNDINISGIREIMEDVFNRENTYSNFYFNHQRSETRFTIFCPPKGELFNEIKEWNAINPSVVNSKIYDEFMEIFNRRGFSFSIRKNEEGVSLGDILETYNVDEEGIVNVKE